MTLTAAGTATPNAGLLHYTHAHQSHEQQQQQQQQQLAVFYLLLAYPLLKLLYWEWSNYIHLTRHLPGPTPIPFIGNALQMGKSAHEILNNLFKFWIEAGKKNFLVTIGNMPNIMITEPKDLEVILKSNEMIQKSDIYDMLHPWLGQGLLTATGTHWSNHRKMITPTFHFGILQNFHETMNANSTKFVQKLRKISAGGKIFDIQSLCSQITLDIICETAMGVQINALDNPDSELANAFKSMSEDINMRAFHPLKRKNSLYKLFPSYQNYRKILKVLQDFTYKVIESRFEKIQNEKSDKQMPENEFVRKKQAFLDTLLTSTIDGKPLSRKDVFDEVSTLIFEGFDTTTSGISFAVFLLSRHPEIQRKVYEEQKQIMGDRMLESATFQEVNEMKYLDLVIKEAQRLYPSVPMVARRADKDYNINGLHVPKGSSIGLLIIAMGYREESFEDPHKFNPERFDIARNSDTFNPFSYIPFSAGPRNCVGQKFAMLELKTVVSKLVRCFEILPPLDELVSKDGYVQHFLGLTEEEARKRYTPHKYDPILSTVLSLKSENGILIRLKEREAFTLPTWDN
nr:cytochrome P450 monooxygenase CYP4E21 [Liriomyza trifolii]